MKIFRVFCLLFGAALGLFCVVPAINHLNEQYDIVFRYDGGIGKMGGVDVFNPAFSIEAKRRNHNLDESVQPTIAGWDGLNNLSSEQKNFILLSGVAICAAITIVLLKPRKKREEDFSGELSDRFAAVPAGEGVVTAFSEFIRSPEKFIDYPNVIMKNVRVVHVFRTDDKAIALVAPDDFGGLNVPVSSLLAVIFDAEDAVDTGDYINEVEGIVREGEVEGCKIFYFGVTDYDTKKYIPDKYRSLLEDVCQVAEIEFEE